MLADFDYHCPLCKHQLNNEQQIEFLVSYKGASRSSLLLSKEPGVYGYRSKHNLTIHNGDRVNFFCSVCEGELKSKKRPDFVPLEIWTNGSYYLDLYFSAICGERLTYLNVEGELMRFGSDFFSIMQTRQGA